MPVLASSVGLPPSSLRIHEPGLLSRLSLSKGPGGDRRSIAAEAQGPGPGVARGGRSSSIPGRPPAPPPKNPGWRRTRSRTVAGLHPEAEVRAVNRGSGGLEPRGSRKRKWGLLLLQLPTHTHPRRGAAGCWLGNHTADQPRLRAETLLVGPGLPCEGSGASVEGPRGASHVRGACAPGRPVSLLLPACFPQPPTSPGPAVCAGAEAATSLQLSIL